MSKLPITVLSEPTHFTLLFTLHGLFMMTIGLQKKAMNRKKNRAHFCILVLSLWAFGIMLVIVYLFVNHMSISSAISLET